LTGTPEARAVLLAYPDELLIVSPRVNSPRNNDRELIKPVAA
jgi:hypothetical protein